MIRKAAWRSYLDEIIQNLDKDQKEALYNAVGVTPMTVNRWRREDTPRYEHLVALLAALPTQQSQRLASLLKEDSDPKIRSLLSSDTVPSPEARQEILLQLNVLDPLFVQLLEMERESPEPFWQLGSRILRQALNELESHSSNMSGSINLTICTCRPPIAGKCRSLWRHTAMGTRFFRRDFHNENLFLGRESLAGYVLSRRHGEVIPDLENNFLQVPFQEGEGGEPVSGEPIPNEDKTVVRSAAAFPIMKKGGSAGVLLAVATTAHYFTPERLALLEMFADLVRFAFQHDSNYIPGQEIELDFMPLLSLQRVHFHQFQTRVRETFEEWYLQDSSLHRLNRVEETVLEQMENELRQMARSERAVSHQGSSAQETSRL